MCPGIDFVGNPGSGKRSILTISKSSSVMILDRMGNQGSKKDAKKKY
jgi:hypothetical protein